MQGGLEVLFGDFAKNGVEIDQLRVKIAGVLLHRPDSSGWSSGLEVPISFLGCKFLRWSFLVGITLAVVFLDVHWEFPTWDILAGNSLLSFFLQ